MQNAPDARPPDPRQHPVDCPVCGSNRSRVKFNPWRSVTDPIALYGAASGVPGTQRLVACTDCGMIYESPRFSDQVILEGYRSARDGHDSQYASRVLGFKRALASLRRVLPAPPARVLDVGTAGGAFLEAAEQAGYIAQGLDPSPSLVESARARGWRVDLGTADAPPFPEKSFDLICLWDVIEHLPNPGRALRALLPLLRPEGRLLINFPDAGTWAARLAGRRYWWILSVHLHHFTRDTLGNLCSRSGFEVIHFQRFWTGLELGYLEEVAIQLGVPGASWLKRATPAFMKKWTVRYTASQTTAVARIQ